jgi:CPA1 family monovalent cation:H+ antiporter
MTSSAIIFTLFIKGLTISKLIKKLKLDSLEELESFEYIFGELNTYHRIIFYISRMYERKRLTKEEFEFYTEKFEAKIKLGEQKIKKIIEKKPILIEKTIRYFSLGIERTVLKDFYQKGLISEKGYRKYRSNLYSQKESLEENQKKGAKFFRDIKLGFKKTFYSKKMEEKELYLYYRTLGIAAMRVITELEKLKKNCCVDNDLINKRVEKVIKEYKGYLRNSNKKKMILVSNEEMEEFRRQVINDEILDKENHILEYFSQNDFITSKLEGVLKEKIKHER